MKRAIREHLRDFVAIGVLAVLAIVTTGIILARQQANFPSWIPFLGHDQFELKAEFSSAQAITPGQGQTVNLSGIKIGSIAGVNLESGVAVVTMNIDPKYAPLIHTDSSLLLRPRTGLQDMTIEIDPGQNNQEVKEGSTVPIANTQPNVNPDQILASLDGDTQSFLQLLLQGGAQGLYGHSEQLSAGLRRFELQVNSIGDQVCRPAYRELLIEYLEGQRERLRDEHRDRFRENPLRVLDCKDEACRDVAADAPKIVDHLCDPCREHFSRVQAGLGELGVAVHLPGCPQRHQQRRRGWVPRGFLAPIEHAPEGGCLRHQAVDASAEQRPCVRGTRCQRVKAAARGSVGWC